ncbi:alpha-amylase family glycosyl hydrolase [Metabacillus sp. HB246100]
MGKRIVSVFITFMLLLSVQVVQAETQDQKDWQEETAYYVEVDRFHNGNPHNDGEDFDPEDPLAYHGGDLEGLTKKIQYIKDMGFSTLILSSIFEEGFEGERIDSHYGTVEDLKALVDEAHKQELLVMVEFDLERLNLASNKGKDNLVASTQKWLVEANIDGFYLHYADLFDATYWESVLQEVKEEELYLVGTFKAYDEKKLAAYLEAGFDSILNKPFYKIGTETFSNVDQSQDSLINHVQHTPNGITNYFDNDETVRFTRYAIEQNQHPGNRFKLAFSFLYTIPGTPFVYYGSEIAVDGAEPPTNRPLMNFQSDEELIEYIGKLATIRNNLPALSKGDFNVLYEQDGMMIFKRTFEGESILVAINNSTKTQKVRIQASEIADDKKLQGLLTGDTFSEENGEYEFILEREVSEIYEIKENTGFNIPLLSVFILVPTLFIGFLILARRKGKKVG